MAGLLSGIIAMLAGWLLHWAIGDHVSVMTDFVVTTIVSGIVYIAAFAWLQRLRG